MLFNFDKALANGYREYGCGGNGCTNCKYYDCSMGNEICLVNCPRKIDNFKVIQLPGNVGWCKKWKKG